MRTAVALFCALTYFGFMQGETKAAEPVTIYIGTYTGGKSEGIYRAVFDSGDGKLGGVTLAAKTASPSFLALHPKKPFLYAVGESASVGPRKEGGVSAYRIHEDGRLELLGQQAAGGSGPCHVSLDETGRCLMVANYGSGSVASFPVLESGALGEARSVIQHRGSSVNPSRQAGPHAHHVIADPENKFALVCDLGLDKVLIYQLNAYKAELASNDPPSASVRPGDGPRHLVFDPKGKFVHVVNEMGNSVTSFRYDAKRGSMQEVGTVRTLPETFKGKSTCAEIQVHPSGKFIYASNRGHDSIVVFRADGGTLEPVQHALTLGKTPRHFALDPTGKWLLAGNQDSDSIAVFRVDRKTGMLTPTDNRVEVGKPVCIVFADQRLLKR